MVHRISFRKALKTKIVAIILIVLFIGSIGLPIAMGASNSIIGTNLALGSPILDEKFKIEEWNKWETVTFGVFLSNFVYPMVDDYRSAFSISGEGSKGEGLKALQFGAGSNEGISTLMQDMLNYMIMNQMSGMKKLHVRNHLMTNGVNYKTVTEYKEATFNDLFLSNNYNFGNMGDVGPFDKLKEWAKLRDTWKEQLETTLINVEDYGEIKTMRYMVLPELSVELTGGTYEVVFSYRNGWDVQMLNAWISYMVNGRNSKQGIKNFETFLKENPPLYLDTFGNIVAYYNNKPYMIFPAAANCHITQTPKYNLIQSVLFGGSYTEHSGQMMVTHGLAREGGGSALSGSDQLKQGGAVILFDLDTLIIDKVKQLSNSGSVQIGDRDFGENGEVPDKTWFDWSNPNIKVEKLEIGSLWAKIMNAGIRNSIANVPFRVEIINGERIEKVPDQIQFLAYYSSFLSSLFPVTSNAAVLDYVKTGDGKKHSIFGSDVVVATDTKNVFAKKYIDSLSDILYGTSGVSYAGVNAMDKEQYRIKLRECKNPLELARWAFTAKEKYEGSLSGWMNSEEISSIFKGYVKSFPKRPKGKNPSLEKATVRDVSDEYDTSDLEDIAKSNSKISEPFTRIVKIYPQSNIMINLSSKLKIEPGTEMSLWSAYIYATYLEWYGVLGSKTHQFNTKLFSEDSDLLLYDIEKATAGQFLSEEEKKKAVLDYTYAMLHPTDGREYRVKMLTDGINDWVHKMYKNIVYGGHYTINTMDSNVSIRSGNGFLHISSLSENYLTKWFVNKYVNYVVIILGICLIIIIITGVISQKKLVWYLASLLLIVNVIIIIPSLGEITPYFANGFIESSFKDRMSYWSMAEAITNNEVAKNTEIEASTIEKIKVTEDEAKQTADLIRKFNVLYLDRSLMLKMDISKKIQELKFEDYEGLQRLASARWLLPMMMRQFTGNDNNSDYIYTPLGDEYANMDNLYNYYVLENNEDVSAQLKRANMYEAYIDTSYNGKYISGGYNNTEIVKIDGGYIEAPGWQSVSRVKDDEKVLHARFYLLPNLRVPGGNLDNIDWDEYIKNNKEAVKQQIIDKTDELEIEAFSYDSDNSDTITDNYGFIWTTQNPLHYFYLTTRDTFKPTSNLAVIAGELQGIYELSKVTGKEERCSFMHYKDTGKIRDFLDMEELFTNVIPYMYKVQILAGGKNLDGGVLEGAKIENYPIYKDNYKAWLYRSNWVSKLMESDLLNQSCYVKDKENKRHKVSNPMLPETYPKERPMVFSEAQMLAMGLNESDLSLPELKILNVNRNVERKWTLLLNYCNLKGVTPEILMKQMALDATLEFNKEFSTGNIFNPSFVMYPVSLDLRGISFDSIMKMILLNTTKDVRYIYGDTIQNVIENSDIIGMILMIITAFLCAFVIPFMSDTALGLLFYLGILALVLSLTIGNKVRIKISTALLVNNLVYLGMAIVFYGLISMLIGITYSDNVLNVKEAFISTGCPVWVFFLLIIISCAYIYGLYKMIKFTIINYRDLGFEIYAVYANNVVGRITDKMEELGSRVSGKSEGAGGIGGVSVGGSRSESIKTSKVEISTDRDDLDMYLDTHDGRFDSGYVIEYRGTTNDREDAMIKDEIDSTIEAGKQKAQGAGM